MLLAVVALWFFRHSDSQPGEIRNVLLISIDTCRADYLSCYGYKRKTTPNIDALAKKGTLFTNVISPVPLTLPAHSTMLTGTIPPYHGVHANIDYKLDQSNVTLADTLKDNDFTTGAIVSAFVLNSGTGLGKGFDSYNDKFEEEILGSNQYAERQGTETTRFALDWLDSHKDDKFFLFLHYYDPHDKYDPPQPFASRFKSNLYAGEIAFTDHCIGKVLARLKGLGLDDSTLIIITGDHGEMLDEHGEKTHGYFIYQSAIKVPLIFKLPGQRKGKVLKEMVGLVDIVPTIYSLLGIEAPNYLQGTSLVDLIRGDEPAKQERHIYCESLFPTKYNANSLLGVLTNRFKYIQTTRPELYDVSSDPQEGNDLITQEPHRARILRDKLAEILEQSLRSGELDSQTQMDTRSRRQLESIGYVGGRVSEDFEFDQTRDDPKDFLTFYNSYLKCKGLVGLRKYKEAEALLKENIRQKPDVYQWYSLMADIAMARRRYPQAIDNFMRVLKLNPDNFQVCNDLAIALQFDGRLTESVDYFRRALKIDPDEARTHFNLAMVLERQKEKDLAIISYRAALRIKPDFAEVHYNLAEILTKKAMFEEAVAHYRSALELAPDMVTPRLKQSFIDIAGKLSKQPGKTAAAIGYLQLVLEAWPDSAQIHLNISPLLARQGKLDEAINHLNEAIRIKPGWAEAHYLLGEMRFRQNNHVPAVTHWKEALKLKPDLAGALNAIAWTLAVSSDNDVYDPGEAVKYGEKACELTNYNSPEVLDTLGVAYAAAKDFPKAIETAQKAIRLATSAGNENLAQLIREHLELYKQGKAYRQ